MMGPCKIYNHFFRLQGIDVMHSFIVVLTFLLLSLLILRYQVSWYIKKLYTYLITT